MAYDTVKLEAKLRQVFETGVPFNSLLGLKVESLDPAKLRFDMRPDLIGNARRSILHGGVISAVLDVAAGFAIHLAVIRQRAESAHESHFPTIGTIDLRVDYLRPAAASISSRPPAWCGSATASRSRTWNW